MKPPSKQSGLAAALSGTGAKVAAAPPPPAAPELPVSAASPSAAKKDVVPLTVHVPEKVRRQLKALAAEQGRTMESMTGEALNLLFARFHKPEIAPQD